MPTIYHGPIKSAAAARRLCQRATDAASALDNLIGQPYAPMVKKLDDLVLALAPTRWQAIAARPALADEALNFVADAEATVARELED